MQRGEAPALAPPRDPSQGTHRASQGGWPGSLAETLAGTHQGRDRGLHGPWKEAGLSLDQGLC